MKIVIVGQRWNPYLKDRVRGGAEKVEANQLILLSKAGHQVHFITNDDSEDPDYEVSVYRVGPSRLTGVKHPGRKRNQAIKNIIVDIEPDVVICHDNDNSSLNRTLTHLQPCVNFVHSHVGMAGGLAALTYIKSLYQMAQEGHLTVCVSASSRREWQILAGKSRKFLMENGVPEDAIESEDNIFTDWFHHAITWDKPEVKPSEKGYITIGRIIPTKRHHVSLSCTDDVRLFCPPPNHPDQKELYEKLVGKYGGGSINATGIPDEELEEEIAVSKALLCFAQESFGLTAVEANIYGVPVILSHRIEDHPIKEACGPSRELGGLQVIPYEKSTKNVKSFLDGYEAIPLDRRQAISDATWGYYNPKASLVRLEDLIKKCIDNHGAVQGSQPLGGVMDLFGG